MPMPIHLAHNLARRLTEVRRSGLLPYLGPDGKSQVTVEYRGGMPMRVDTVVISAQHSPEVGQDTIRKDILRHVVRAVISTHLLDENTKYFVNYPADTRRFVDHDTSPNLTIAGAAVVGVIRGESIASAEKGRRELAWVCALREPPGSVTAITTSVFTAESTIYFLILAV